MKIKNWIEQTNKISNICEKFEREFFGGGIPSFLENSYLECEENVRTFPSSFRLVPHNVSGIPATLWLTIWTECEDFVSLNEDPY